MERGNKEKTVQNDGKIWYRKIGGGSMYLKIDGKLRIIAPGMKFQAHPNDIPPGSVDLALPLEAIPITPEKEKELIKAKIPAYSLLPSDKEGEEGLFYIVNEKGKIIGENALDEKAANQLIEDLGK
jgi:hypothetical protein